MTRFGVVVAGDNVLYGKFDGMAVEYNDAKHTLIRDDDVLLTWQGNKFTIDAVSTVRDRWGRETTRQQGAGGSSCCSHVDKLRRATVLSDRVVVSSSILTCAGLWCC